MRYAKKCFRYAPVGNKRWCTGVSTPKSLLYEARSGAVCVQFDFDLPVLTLTPRNQHGGSITAQSTWGAHAHSWTLPSTIFMLNTHYLSMPATSWKMINLESLGANWSQLGFWGDTDIVEVSPFLWLGFALTRLGCAHENSWVYSGVLGCTGCAWVYSGVPHQSAKHTRVSSSVCGYNQVCLGEPFSSTLRCATPKYSWHHHQMASSFLLPLIAIRLEAVPHWWVNCCIFLT
jgi:hypothetical protein